MFQDKFTLVYTLQTGYIFILVCQTLFSEDSPLTPRPPSPAPRRYEAALSDFEETQLKLRSNPFIDYKQLGLQYKLYACEVTWKIDKIV